MDYINRIIKNQGQQILMAEVFWGDRRQFFYYDKDRRRVFSRSEKSIFPRRFIREEAEDQVGKLFNPGYRRRRPIALESVIERQGLPASKARRLEKLKIFRVEILAKGGLLVVQDFGEPRVYLDIDAAIRSCAHAQENYAQSLKKHKIFQADIVRLISLIEAGKKIRERDIAFLSLARNPLEASRNVFGTLGDDLIGELQTLEDIRGLRRNPGAFAAKLVSLKNQVGRRIRSIPIGDRHMAGRQAVLEKEKEYLRQDYRLAVKKLKDLSACGVLVFRNKRFLAARINNISEVLNYLWVEPFLSRAWECRLELERLLTLRSVDRKRDCVHQCVAVLLRPAEKKEEICRESNSDRTRKPIAIAPAER